jgi:LmbE family N-acetylglucosaminyl deacetylase
VFSLGATVSAATRSGCSVAIVTVFAGDPDSTIRAGWWDERAGFSTAGESARVRRKEDRLACDLLKVTPVWLPFLDSQYEQTATDEEVWTAIEPTIEKAEILLIPGSPLRHPDHARLARILLEKKFPRTSIGLYAEQPYTWRRTVEPAVPPLIDPLLSAPVQWLRLHPRPLDVLAKARAARAYRTQMRLIARLLILRMMLYELRQGGERLAWVSEAEMGGDSQ